jgi:hypothetical protein
MTSITKRLAAFAGVVAMAAVPSVALAVDGPLVTADWL